MGAVVEIIERDKFLNTELSTIVQVADYFEINPDTIDTIIKRNKKDITQKGAKLYRKNEILNMIDGLYDAIPMQGKTDVVLSNGVKFTVPNRGLWLFNKDSISFLGLLLKESSIANKMKRSSNIYVPRKEISFKMDLEKHMNFLKTEYTSRRKSINGYNKKDDRFFEFEAQVTMGEFRVDFYFPHLDLVVEYDEIYHENPKQKKLDQRREDWIRIELDIRNPYYNNNDAWGIEQFRDFTVYQFADDCNSYADVLGNPKAKCCNSFDFNKSNPKDSHCPECGVLDISKFKSMGNIVRVKEGYEEEGLLRVVSYIMDFLRDAR